MDILGIGGWELIAILMIMLIVAGPKRMIQWSYTLGQYVARLKRMWSETAAALQQELDQAGVDVKVPKQIPTRQTLNRDLTQALNKMAKPVTAPVEAMQDELKQTTSLVSTPEGGDPSSPAHAEPVPVSSFGTWSNGSK